MRVLSVNTSRLNCNFYSLPLIIQIIRITRITVQTASTGYCLPLTDYRQSTLQSHGQNERAQVDVLWPQSARECHPYLPDISPEIRFSLYRTVRLPGEW